MSIDYVKNELLVKNIINLHKELGMNYLLIDKGLLSPDSIDTFIREGYSVVVGYGDKARVKISW